MQCVQNVIHIERLYKKTENNLESKTINQRKRITTFIAGLRYRKSNIQNNNQNSSYLVVVSTKSTWTINHIEIIHKVT